MVQGRSSNLQWSHKHRQISGSKEALKSQYIQGETCWANPKYDFGPEEVAEADEVLQTDIKASSITRLFRLFTLGNLPPIRRVVSL